MRLHVDVKPELFRWARERAGKDMDTLVHKFPKYREWENGEVRPTLRQLENFAKVVHTGVGYFFLSEPPDEPFPIPDFRTVGGAAVGRPSLNLIHTIYLCQQRQDWYQEFARAEGEDPLPFVGSARLSDDVETVAARMRDALGFDLEERRNLQTWAEALRSFVEKADELGVLVMVSGVVGNNTHRRLNPEEFRGFALADDLAPLIFVNGADTKAAQMFTLAHELAHLWLGETALSDSSPNSTPTGEVESWCNRVAAELLAPLSVVRAEYREEEELSVALQRIAQRFKVSTLVALRRLYDAGGLTRVQFQQAYDAEREKLRSLPRSVGGSFHPTLRSRVGRRFGRALVTSAFEGRTSFTESFRLLGIRKISSMRDFAESLGVPV